MNRPTQQQIADAIVRVHRALHEAWPPAEIFNDADIAPMKKMAWLAQWHKAREGWRDQVETLVEQLSLAVSIDALEEMVSVTCAALEESAREFQVEMMRLLDQ